MNRAILIVTLLMAVPCMAQEQPWPVTSNDPAFLELTVNEIYNRVRVRVDSLVNNYLGASRIEVDTIAEFGNDSEYVFLHVNRLFIKGTDLGAGIVMFEQSTFGSNYAGFRVGTSLANDIVWLLPDGDGSAGEVLKTDGVSNLGWFDLSGITHIDSLDVDDLVADTGTVVLLTATTLSGDTLNYNDGYFDTLTAVDGTILEVTTDSIAPTAGVLTLWGAALLIRDNRDATPTQSRLWLFEDPDNGDDYIAIVPPASSETWAFTLPADNGDAGEVLTNTDGFATLDWGQGVWSRTGDTLVQSGVITSTFGGANVMDTVSLPIEFSDTGYKVTLTWNDNGTSSPAVIAAKDSLFVYHPVAPVAQYATDEFIIVHGYTAAAVYIDWIATGN